MRRGLQIVLGVLSLIPLIFGTLNIWNGSAEFLGAENVSASLDSQFRFLSAYYVGLALMIWWIIPRIERETVVFRILIGVIFLGGVARVLSWSEFGAPASNMIFGTVLELALPLLLIWQAKVRDAAST